MSEPRLDVLAIGNAIVDVIAEVNDGFLDAEGLTKGSMRLVDADEAERLYSHMANTQQVSGGSAGNTAAGIAALGGRAGFIGQVAPDQLGEFYIHDLRSTGVEFTCPPADFGVPTARSMVLVTPDGAVYEAPRPPMAPDSLAAHGSSRASYQFSLGDETIRNDSTTPARAVKGMEALARLPVPYRQPRVLADIADLSTAEIGRMGLEFKINAALEEAVLNHADHTSHQLQQVVRRVVGTWVNRKLRRKP